MAKNYLSLPEGRTTFTIDFINMFRFVHFVNDSAGTKRKRSCMPYSCTYCQNGNRRVTRLSISVIHNGDTKILEIGSALGHQIVNSFSTGDKVTIERIGTGFSTRYNIIGSKNLNKVSKTPKNSIGRDEGIKELMYDVQRTNNYDEKYDLIIAFARKF